MESIIKRMTMGRNKTIIDEGLMMMTKKKEMMERRTMKVMMEITSESTI